mmetsp:Transcript_44297/g.110150  ORF Transcript_44297/g.110150 Transcript_44297/m.110150 type:complete len:225 (-) Transcript_44297:181-855(-)
MIEMRSPLQWRSSSGSSRHPPLAKPTRLRNSCLACSPSIGGCCGAYESAMRWLRVVYSLTSAPPSAFRWCTASACSGFHTSSLTRSVRFPSSCAPMAAVSRSLVSSAAVRSLPCLVACSIVRSVSWGTAVNLASSHSTSVPERSSPMTSHTSWSKWVCTTKSCATATATACVDLPAPAGLPTATADFSGEDITLPVTSGVIATAWVPSANSWSRSASCISGRGT